MADAELTALSVNEYLDRLASGDPTPGGGSAAALAAALGAALASMVCNLTLGRDTFAAIEPEIRALVDRSEQLRARLRSGVDEDARAYGEVMAAFRRPRTTDAEKARRGDAIQATSERAARVPLAIAEDCATLLALCQELVGKTNPHAASDIAVAALLAGAALDGAAANVEINLRSIKDDQLLGEMRARLATLRAQRESGVAAVLAGTTV